MQGLGGPGGVMADERHEEHMGLLHLPGLGIGRGRSQTSSWTHLTRIRSVGHLVRRQEGRCWLTPPCPPVPQPQGPSNTSPPWRLDRTIMDGRLCLQELRIRPWGGEGTACSPRASPPRQTPDPLPRTLHALNSPRRLGPTSGTSETSETRTARCGIQRGGLGEEVPLHPGRTALTFSKMQPDSSSQT
jgi:hypothetical protein